MTLGLIAGNGRFPFLVLGAARRRGDEVTVVAIKGEAFIELEEIARDLGGTAFHWVPLGQLEQCITILEDAGITSAVMAGQVKHVKMFTDVMPDQTMLRVLGELRGKNTDALISGIAGVLEARGITLLDSTTLLADLVAPAGVLSRMAPSEAQRADLAFGYRIADVIAGHDIGQTVIVKDRAVVAVEAMEGTDVAIARAGGLAGRGTRVIKVAKPSQDMRFDVPVVGVATIDAMRKAGADALSIDAGRTLVIDGDAFYRAADEAGVVVVGRGTS